MLPFFTEPYPDELIYSAIGRYHYYSGNIDCKDTLEEVFKSRNVIPSIEIGSHFNTLAQQMGPNYSVASLLAKHTIYPFYSPFLSKKRQQEVFQDVQDDGKALYTRLGFVAGSICKKNGLYYCPRCAKSDIERYGEPYIHREHQLQGIDICAHHELRLKKYPVDFSMQSRIEFVRFEAKRISFSVLQEVESYEYFETEVQLAKMAYQLLHITKLSREIINQKYHSLLREHNLVTVSNRVRQAELYQAFHSKLPTGLLEKYDSAINVADEYNWLKVITRNSIRHVHPIRHLLFFYYLDLDVPQLFLVKENQGPFGKGPWPCLNKAAIHYKKHVISRVTVTRDFKSNASIGTFNCSCGFIYSRKGPDKLGEDQFQIGRIKAFGDVWEDKLRTLANEEELSTRGMAKILGVDSKTVKKYLNVHEKEGEIFNISHSLLFKKYREQLIIGIQQYPDYTRTQIRNSFPKQYMYLYRHDKEWLFEQLPKNSKNGIPNMVVDWSKRDDEYYEKVKQLYKELIALEKPIRITNSLIGKRLGILANLDKHIDKLPRTRELLNDLKESTKQFQIRRCYKIIDRLLREQEPIELWKVQRIGAVKSHHFHEIKSDLEAYIQMKREVKSYEQTTG